MIATGGRYTFRYNTSTNMLVIKFKPYSEIVELFGDIKVELLKAKGDVFSGSVRLDAGEYKFKINEMGTELGFKYTFTDSVVNVEYNPLWTGETTFKATGGIYTVNFDTSTNKLTFMHAPKGLGEVRIFGSLGIDLAEEKGTTYYSASTVLEAGEYTFRIDKLGTTYCYGGTFTDKVNGMAYNSAWKGATTFNATGGMYTFRFDSKTNKLTITRDEMQYDVAIYGDINIGLETADGVTYTGKVTLEAGSHSFRIYDTGKVYCYGGTFKNSINKTYSTAYKSATVFEANGGEYKFTYNKNTHLLNLVQVA